MSTEVSQAKGASRWRHLQHGLGKTLLIWFLLLPVISLVIAGIMAGTIAIQNARHAAIDRLTAIATLKQSEINTWVASQQEELDLIVNTPDVRSKMLYTLSARSEDPLATAAQDQLQVYVSVIATKGSSFEELFLLDASGRVRLSSDPSQVGASHGLQAYFIKGKESPYVHPPYYSLFTAAPSIIIAQPVKDDAGRRWGVLAGRLSLDQLAKVMTEEAGLGQTGETYLINAAGLLLTPLRAGGELTSGQEIRTEGVARGLALGSSGSEVHSGWSTYTNYRGRPVLGVYRWFPDLQVVLLAEQEVSETLAFTRGILATSLVILVVVAALSAIIALLVSGRITRPLVGLTTSANLIASGDLSQAVPHTRRRDEIGTLARAFDLMSQQLHELITGLEEQVTRRTHQWQEVNYKLQRRAIQLETVTLVGRAITSILNLDDLLLEVVNLIRTRFDFYHAGVFLIDESGGWAVLRQATGEAGQRMLGRKHRLSVGGKSIVGWATANRQPRIALDVGEDAVHFKNPNLPHTRSEMALPLMVGNRLLGALDVQSTKQAAFDDEDVAILSLMADQVAIAIDNALKFSQEAAILEATSPVYRASRRIALATSLDDVLGSVVDHAAGPYVDCCAIYLYSTGTEGRGSGCVEVAALWDHAADPPHPPGTRYPAQGSSLFEDLRQEAAEPLVVTDLLAEEIDRRIDISAHRLLAEELQFRAVLILPLIAAGQTTGLLVVASRQPHAWTEAELRIFRSLSDQAAIAVENVRLLGEAQARAGRERVIRQITERMWRAVDVESILQATVTSLGQAVDAPRVYVRLDTEASPRGVEADLDNDSGARRTSSGNGPHSLTSGSSS
jgi:GAF domain-containing protein/HAMP domain-containing protein